MSARALRLLGVTVAVLAAYFVAPVHGGAATSVLARAAGLALALLLLAYLVIDQVRRALVDPDHRVDGLLVAILCVWTGFSLAFYVLEVQQPGQVDGLETRIDSLYFTASTMMTVGYGDIHARGQEARGLVLLQMLFNVVFVATAGGLLSDRVRRVAQRRQQGDAGGVSDAGA